MKRPLISLTSDFGVQSQGIGCMKGVALETNPDANVIDLMHGLPDFDLAAASRTMETVKYLPVGYHVCVVDPGVGTKRNAIIIKQLASDLANQSLHSNPFHAITVILLSTGDVDSCFLVTSG